MNEFIKGFTSRGSDLIEAQGEAKSSKKIVKNLEKTLEVRDDRILELVRGNSRTITMYERDISETREDHEHAMSRLLEDVSGDVEEAELKADERVAEAEADAQKSIKETEQDAKRDVARAEDSAEQRVRRVKEESTHAISLVEEAAEADIKNVKINADIEAANTYADQVDVLTTNASDAAEEAARQEGRADALDTVNASLRSDLKTHDELIKFVMTKLPNVDLSKFAINVDVPATQVIVENKTTRVSKK